MLSGLAFLIAIWFIWSTPPAALAKGGAARGLDTAYGSTSKRGCVNGVCPLKGERGGNGGGGNKSCSAHASICAAKKGNGSTKVCEAAAASCMQTGTWRSPNGRVFSNVPRN